MDSDQKITNKPKVVIIIEGGVCQQVIADQEIEVSVIDYDFVEMEDLTEFEICPGNTAVNVDPDVVASFYMDPVGFATVSRQDV